MKCAKLGKVDKTEQEEHRKKLRSGYVTTAHQTDVLKLQDELNSNVMTGLTSSAYTAALAKYGANALTPQKHDGPFVLWLKATFTGFFNVLLLFGSVLCFLGFGLDSNDETNLYLGVVLSAVVIITGTFSWYQDSAARAIMEGFKNMLPQSVSVVREGTPRQERPESLVPGDLIALRTGDSVPADVRIVSCSNDMQVDNSAMTGESEPQDRAVACTSDLPAETKNLAFFGTKVLRGDCMALVISTGDRTMMGRIAALVDSTDNEETPIKLEIKHFIKIITIVAVSLGVLFFLIGIVIGRAWIENMVFMIGIIVANVPEGLLATVTIGLAVTAHRMGKKNVLVKNLEAVETLGSTSVICSDKTGTLTMNVMTMANVWYDYTAFDVDVRDPMKGTFDVNEPSMAALMHVGCLCNNVVKETVSSASAGQEHKTVALRGDASEQGIAKFLDPHFGGHFESTREQNPKLFGIPFNSANKWQLSVHQLSNSNVFSGDTGSNGPLLVLKGAPEVVVDFCDRILHKGKEVTLDAKARAEIASGVQQLGNQGKRVLGFAMSRLDETVYGTDYKYSGATRADTNLPLRQQAGDGGLVFVGLMAMVDPYRPGVPEAVATCQNAGVKVIMVTGDHPVTAKAIARQVGIIQPHHLTVEEVAAKKGIPVADVDDEEVEAVVVQGHDLAKITECPTDEQIQFWNRTLNKPGVVFARTSPQQKLLIVEACQARGGIVAVTGDGVNDAPALKKANIGVAMGIAGTQVAKDAADMIIMDDNFATIVVGIEEGRIIFDNLKKSISYTLSSNIPELMPFLVYILIGIPLPLSTVLILCIDLGTDMLPAISFAYEPKEADIMRRLPRDPTKDRLVTPQLISFAYLQIGVIQAIAGFYAYLVVMSGEGFPMASLPGLASSGDYGKKVLYACANRFPTCTYGAAKEYDSLEMQSICGSAGLDGRVNFGRGYFQAHEQELILRTAQTAFFVSIVISQWADLLICKTRSLSLFSQGLTNNVMIAGLIEETLLCIFLSYTPGVQDVLGTAPLKLEYWTPTVPFTVLIYVYDEVRKWWIRAHKGGWLDRYTAW